MRCNAQALRARARMLRLHHHDLDPHGLALLNLVVAQLQHVPPGPCIVLSPHFSKEWGRVGEALPCMYPKAAAHCLQTHVHEDSLGLWWLTL